MKYIKDTRHFFIYRMTQLFWNYNWKKYNFKARELHIVEQQMQPVSPFIR